MKLSFVTFVFFCVCIFTNAYSKTTSGANLAAAGDTLYNASPKQSQQLLAGKWMLIPAMSSDTATGKIPFLHFDAASNRVSGNTGCNGFGGMYKTDNGNLYFTSNMMKTKMACEGYDEAAFLKNLSRTNRYEIHGDTLVLKQDVTPLSYWLKQR